MTLNREQVDTSAATIAKMIAAAPFADNEAGIPQMVELIKALAAERDAARQALMALENGLTIADYEEVLADKRRLARELDEALHGVGNTAKQASLCDLIHPAEQLRAERDALLTELKALDKWVTDSLQEAGADISNEDELKRFRAMDREWFGAGVGASFAESIERSGAALEPKS